MNQQGNQSGNFCCTQVPWGPCLMPGIDDLWPQFWIQFWDHLKGFPFEDHRIDVSHSASWGIACGTMGCFWGDWLRCDERFDDDILDARHQLAVVQPWKIKGAQRRENCGHHQLNLFQNSQILEENPWESPKSTGSSSLSVVFIGHQLRGIPMFTHFLQKWPTRAPGPWQERKKPLPCAVRYSSNCLLTFPSSNRS